MTSNVRFSVTTQAAMAISDLPTIEVIESNVYS